MDLETPEGHLSVSDTELTFVPTDNSPEIAVKLDSDPDYRYERGVYGLGTLVIDGHVIVLKNDQAAQVVEELRRPRAAGSRKTGKAEARSDSDTATTK